MGLIVSFYIVKNFLRMESAFRVAGYSDCFPRTTLYVAYAPPGGCFSLSGFTNVATRQVWQIILLLYIVKPYTAAAAVHPSPQRTGDARSAAAVVLDIQQAPQHEPPARMQWTPPTCRRSTSGQPAAHRPGGAGGQRHAVTAQPSSRHAVHYLIRKHPRLPIACRHVKYLCQVYNPLTNVMQACIL